MFTWELFRNGFIVYCSKYQSNEQLIGEPKTTYFARASNRRFSRFRQSSYKKIVEVSVFNIKEYLQCESTINSDQSIHYKTHTGFEQYLWNDDFHSLMDELVEENIEYETSDRK
jgi:hypothetical protein